MAGKLSAPQPVRKLLASADEITLIDPPAEGMERIITRLRFDNHDSSSATPTFYIREHDHDKFTTETPELWRLQIARVVAAGAQDEDCGEVAILGPTQSLTVQLAADPSDTSDDQKWPAVTVYYIDVVTRLAA